MKKQKQAIVYEGKTYLNLTHLCRELKVNYNTVFKRRAKTPYETMDYWLYGVARKPIVYNGVTYKSYKNLCDTLGLKYSTLMKCTNNDKYEDLEDIVNHLLHKITYRGKEYRYISDICKDYNINIGKLYRMVSYHKDKTPTEVLDKIIDSRGITYKGITYKNKRQMCKSLGVNYNTFIYRYNKHIDKGLDYCLYG